MMGSAKTAGGTSPEFGDLIRRGFESVSRFHAKFRKKPQGRRRSVNRLITDSVLKITSVFMMP